MRVNPLSFFRPLFPLLEFAMRNAFRMTLLTVAVCTCLAIWMAAGLIPGLVAFGVVVLCDQTS